VDITKIYIRSAMNPWLSDLNRGEVGWEKLITLIDMIFFLQTLSII
jgi:hypothetical protein